MRHQTLEFGIALVALVALGMFAACSHSNPVLEPAALKGVRPAYATTRSISSFSNQGAVVRAVWIPGLDDGYVPQGVTFADGYIVVASYGEEENDDNEEGACRVFRIDPLTGELAGYFDLPKQISHAGGLAYDRAGTLYVADPDVLMALDLAGSLATDDHSAVVKATAKLGDALRGSFIAFDGKALWVGRWDRSRAQAISRIDPTRIRDGATLGNPDVSGRLPISALSQGAAFDGKGRLWLSQSNSKFGRIQVVDPTSGEVLQTYGIATAVEDLTFAPDGTLYTVSEAGARRYLKWSAFHPLIFALDTAKLK